MHVIVPQGYLRLSNKIHWYELLAVKRNILCARLSPCYECHGMCSMHYDIRLQMRGGGGRISSYAILTRWVKQILVVGRNE